VQVDSHFEKYIAITEKFDKMKKTFEATEGEIRKSICNIEVLIENSEEKLSRL